jgi:heme/copper-type cytochrome/quinol oxidase subunit 2
MVTWAGIIVKGLQIFGMGAVIGGVETGLHKMTQGGHEQKMATHVSTQSSEKNEYGGYIAIAMIVGIVVVVIMILIILVVVVRVEYSTELCLRKLSLSGGILN